MKLLIKRLYAGLLDAFFMGLPAWVLYHTFIQQSLGNSDFKISYGELGLSITTLTMSMLFIYFIVCEVVGQSIGKKIFGIKIVYNKKGIVAKCLRPILKIITLYIWPVGIISLFLPNNMLFYDYFLKTKIEEIKPEISGGSLR